MMLFFLVINQIKKSHDPFSLTARIKKIAPLQVRNCCKHSSHEKRALSWISCRVQGSLSLEAAMCLSLFLFLCVCLMMPMRMMDRQRQIQAVMESVGEELSQYAYVEYCFQASGEDGSQVDVGRSEEGDRSSLLAAGYAAARILGQIDRDWVESVSFAGTAIGEDDMVHIVMKYRMRLPFSVLGLSSIPVEQVCSRRMWTGAEGGRYEDTRGNDVETEEVMVYVGKNSTRYHHLRTCHYLYNDLKTVSIQDVEGLRNQSGSRYSPCRICGAEKGGAGTSGTVYVMPYGTSYHRSRTCSSIIAYVQAVPLSQVEYLGECSYCRGK